MTDLVEWLPDPVVVIDAEGVLVRGNRAAERVMRRDRREWLGASGLDLVHPDDVHLAAISLASVSGKEVGTPIELRIATADGWRLVEVVGAPLDDGFIALSMRDLTERRRWEVAGGQEALFRALVQHASAFTMLVSGDGEVASVSAALTRLVGHDPELVCGRALNEIVVPADRPLVSSALDRAIRMPTGAGPVAVEAALTCADGRAPVPFELSIVSLLEDPTVQGLVVSGHDITRLRAAQESLAELAHYDALTGLQNRRAFDAALEREWTLTNDDGIDTFVVVLDLDRFKDLNDRHGHAAGDAALREVGHALRQSVRETDLVARIGGDEFAVLLIRCGGEAAALGFGSILRDRLSERLGRLPRPVGVSIGHASLRGAMTPSDALHQADMAMLACKP